MSRAALFFQLGSTRPTMHSAPMSQPSEEPLPEAPVEFIPPSQQQGRTSRADPSATNDERNATAQIIAHWLDDFIKIPGTTFRIGLDPIMSLVPGVGDFLASSVSLVTIIESVRTGQPVDVDNEF